MNNKVEIDLKTYNKLYDDSKEYEELLKQYNALTETYIEYKKTKENEIEDLNKKIDNFLFNILDLDSNKYVHTEICNFNISDINEIADYITENYLEKANKMFEDKEVNE